MGADDEQPADGSEKVDNYFKCCKTIKCKCVVCVNCGAAYHPSCSSRNKFLSIDATRIVCCGNETTSRSPLPSSGKFTFDQNSLIVSNLRRENELLRSLVDQSEDKNLILKENNALLHEKISDLLKQLSELRNFQSPETINVASTSTQCRDWSQNPASQVKQKPTYRDVVAKDPFPIPRIVNASNGQDTDTLQSTKRSQTHKQQNADWSIDINPLVLSAAPNHRNGITAPVSNAHGNKFSGHTGTKPKVKTTSKNNSNVLTGHKDVDSAGLDDNSAGGSGVFSPNGKKRTTHDAFVTVSHRNRRIKSITIGDAQVDGGFTGVPKRVWILLSRVAEGVTAEDIVQFLLGKPGFENRTFQIDELLSERLDSKRFRIGADFALKDQLYDTSFWPRGVRFSRYFWSRKSSALPDGSEKPSKNFLLPPVPNQKP